MKGQLFALRKKKLREMVSTMLGQFRRLRHPDMKPFKPFKLFKVEATRAIAEAQARAKRHGIAMRVYSLQPEELLICDQDPMHTLFVNWEGWLSPCITLAYAKKRIFCGHTIELPIYRFGNVNDQELPDIWDKSAYREFRGVFQARSNKVHIAKQKDNVKPLKLSDLPPAPEVCQSCHYLYNL